MNIDYIIGHTDLGVILLGILALSGWLTRMIYNISKTMKLALKGEKLVRVLGKNSLVSDGYRTYFVEDGVFPEVIESLGE